LWNAQPSTAALPTVTIVGNQLTIKVPSNVRGTWQISVTVSNGKLTATQTFTVTA
jgi:hypothetical protein